MNTNDRSSHSTRANTLSKKHHPPSGADLLARIERTRREGKHLRRPNHVTHPYKTDRPPAPPDLLKASYPRRAEQLRGQGYSRHAAPVLEAASRFDEKNVEWITKITAEMARCGEVARTL